MLQDCHLDGVIAVQSVNSAPQDGSANQGSTEACTELNKIQVLLNHIYVPRDWSAEV